MTCYFTKILVHPLIVVAVCNFSVYKLIGNPPRIYLFKVNARKRYEVCLKLATKIEERYSGVFIANFEHIRHFRVFLFLTFNRKMDVGELTQSMNISRCFI